MGITSVLLASFVGAKPQKEETPLEKLAKRIELHLQKLDEDSAHRDEFIKATQHPSLTQFNDKSKELVLDQGRYKELNDLSEKAFNFKVDQKVLDAVFSEEDQKDPAIKALKGGKTLSQAALGIAKEVADNNIKFFNKVVAAVPVDKRQVVTPSAPPAEKESGSEANPLDIDALSKFVKKDKYNYPLVNDGKVEIVVLPTDAASEGGSPKIIPLDDGLGKSSANYFHWKNSKTGESGRGIWIEVEEPVSDGTGGTKMDTNYVAILGSTNGALIQLKKTDGKYSKDSATLLKKPPVPAKAD